MLCELDSHTNFDFLNEMYLPTNKLKQKTFYKFKLI
jgi:hypothetical protein